MTTKEQKLAIWSKILSMPEAEVVDLLSQAGNYIGLEISSKQGVTYVTPAALAKTGRSIHGPRNLAQTFARWQKTSCYQGITINGQRYPDARLTLAFLACVEPMPSISNTGNYDRESQERMFNFLQRTLLSDKTSLSDKPTNTPVVPDAKALRRMTYPERLRIRISLFEALPREQADQILIDACKNTPIKIGYNSKVGAYATRESLKAARLSPTGPRDYFLKARVPFKHTELDDGTYVYPAKVLLPYLARATFQRTNPEDAEVFERIRDRIVKSMNLDIQLFLPRREIGGKKNTTQITPVENTPTPIPQPMETGSWDRVSATIKDRINFLMEQKRIAEENGLPWDYIVKGLL